MGLFGNKKVVITDGKTYQLGEDGTVRIGKQHGSSDRGMGYGGLSGAEGAMLDAIIEQQIVKWHNPPTASEVRQYNASQDAFNRGNVDSENDPGAGDNFAAAHGY